MKVRIRNCHGCNVFTCLLIFNPEAVHWLKLVSRESHKTENVDLQELLSATQRCLVILSRLLETENNSIRMSALEQLIHTLQYHESVFKATQLQLQKPSSSTTSPDQATRVSSSRAQPTLSSHTHRGREYDEQSKRSASTLADMTSEVSVRSDSSYNASHTFILSGRLMAIEETVICGRGNVSFSDVMGLHQAKQALKEAVVLPLKYAHLFSGGGCSWNRVLLYGPPGTGKTRLAQAVSGEIAATFYCVSSSDLISSWVGESEKIIRDLFAHARKSGAQSVIFIDEVDSICRRRHSQEEEHTRRVKTELLRQMEGADFHQKSNSKEFFLLCATNCPWELDPAFLRRFQRRIYIPLPDKMTCRKIIEQKLDPHASNFSEEDWDSILSKAVGLSGSDLSVCATDTLLQPIRELEHATHWRAQSSESADSLLYTPCKEEDEGATEHRVLDLPLLQVFPRKISARDLMDSIDRCGRTVKKEDLDRFTMFTDMYGQIG